MSPQARTPAWLPHSLALALFGCLAWRFDFLVDDAFITFRYGANLARGHGLSFNPGESPPVEGFSNFLWVLYSAAIQRAGLDPALWSRVASFACGAVLIWLVARTIARRISSEASVTLPASLFAATLPPLAVWATSGLEAMPFALAVFGTFERLLGERERPRALRAGLWAGLACLLRADGFVWIAMVVAAAFVASWRERNAALSRAVSITLGCAAATTAAYIAFRWSYFGELEPNTARAKVHLGALSLERGACYVASLLLCIASIPIAIAGAAARARRDPSGLAFPSLIVVLASFVYLIVVGGDWMMMYRMLVPALAFVALLLAVLLASVRSPLARYGLGTACVALSILPSFDVHVVPRAVRELAHFRWSQEYRTEHEVWRKGVVDIADWIELGRAVALHTQPGESMVLGNIGAIGFHALDLVIHDTHGLTNRREFAPIDPTARQMPGHDRIVAIDAFADVQPTYFAASLVAADQPYAGIPAKWRDPSSDAAQKYELIVHPLDERDGFRPGKALLLVKYRR